MGRSPSWVMCLAFNLVICCMRHGLSLETGQFQKRQQELKFPPVGGSRFLLSFSPGDDEPNSQETQQQFDYTYKIKREHDGRMIICQRTTCPPGTEVKPCEKNYGDDTCVDCPPGKQMLDSTRSEARVLHCVDIPSCHDWPGTIETAENHQCAGGFRMKCRCNTEDGKCGNDPCHCSKHSCADGEKLQQNCDCTPVRESSTLHTSKPKVTIRRAKTSTMSSPQVALDKDYQTRQNKTSNTTVQPVLEEILHTVHRTGVIFPRPFPNNKAKKKKDHWPESDDWKTISTSVAIMFLIVILVLCCISLTCCRKKTKQILTESLGVIHDVFAELETRIRNPR